ncbi:MAG TPA: PLP-dependent aminotransferase family protein [Mycobacteriales bacterium]
MTNGSSTERVLADLRRTAAGGRPGDLLPSTRQLVARHGVGPVTVTRAVARLAAEGVVVSEPGRGTYVAAPRPRRADPPDLGWQTVALADRAVGADDLVELLAPAEPGALVLATGYLDAELQPTRLLADALSRAARRPGSWHRPPLSGVPELRAALAAPSGVDPADVLVVPGGQAGITTALRALVPPGSAIAVESPTYLGVLVAARMAGLRPVPVPVDGGGLRPDLLADALGRSGARLVYCQPAYANPTGVVTPAARRAEILDVVRDAGVFLLEDDYARWLGIDGDAPPPMVRDDPDGHVVNLTSLTKVTAPSLRVGALVARGPAAARLRAQRVVDDFFVPGPMQESAVELLAAAGWRRHLVALRRALAARRDALLQAVSPYVDVPRVPGGGLHLWARLPDGADDVEVAARAARRGLRVSSGTPYFAGEPPAPYLRLTYAAEPPDRLVAAARMIGELLASPSATMPA